ncbi:MAG: tol-pal system protein YbgF [Gammaproteobacteria bacterium]|nr:tol-pal system protein YbgF [Gammaproteobacteria bacterium]
MMTRKLATACAALMLSGSVWAAESTLRPEQRIEVLERQVQALSGLLLRMDALQREVQQLRGELELQTNALEALKQRQRDLYLDIDERLTQPSSAEQDSASVDSEAPATQTTVVPEPSASPAPVAIATSASANEERAYQKAFELLSQRRYEESAKLFREFLVQYPAGVYADNAQYWLGETSYVTRDFSSALIEFKRLLEHYPESPKVSGALLKIGYIEYDTQDPARAKETLTSLIERFPGSSAARLAEEFIRKKKL